MKAYARIGEILERSAVVFVTHSLVQLYRICDTVAVLRQDGFQRYQSIGEAVDVYLDQDTCSQATPALTEVAP